MEMKNSGSGVILPAPKDPLAPAVATQGVFLEASKSVAEKIRRGGKKSKRVVESETGAELPPHLVPFTPEELEVKPKRKKRPMKMVPVENKTAEYLEKRRRNTMAVDKWRKAKEALEKRMKERLAHLEVEHGRARATICRYQSQRAIVLTELQILQQRVEGTGQLCSSCKNKTD